MGHLVNSISTRIGWFNTWKDDIYLDFKHQCDYVHYFIRIRFLLVFLFFAKEPWDEYVVIFSHFELFKKKRVINLFIYVYLGKLIMFGADLQKFFSNFVKSAVRRRRRRFRHFRSGSMIKRFLIQFFYFFKEDYEYERCFTIVKDKRLNRSYKKLKKKDFYEFMQEADFAYTRAYNFDIFRFFIKFYRPRRGILRNKVSLLRGLALRAHLERALIKYDTIKKVFEAAFFVHAYSPFFSWFCEYIEYLISNWFLSNKLAVSFFYFTIMMLHLLLFLGIWLEN